MALYPPAGASDAQIMKNITMIRGMGDKAYVRDVLEARRDFLRLRGGHEKQIAGAYNRAAENVAKRARDVAKRGKLTTRNLVEIEKNLRAEAQRITEMQRSLMRDGYRRSFESAGRPSGNSLIRGIESAGASDKLKIAKIQHGFGQINTAAVEAFWSRTRDGVRVSDRIWQINQVNVQETMRDILETGIASGRDAVQVANDLERYVKRGRRTLSKDYPNMMRRMGKRIPKRLNYEALRLVRTEYTKAFQEGVVSRGAVNPAYEGVQFLLSSGHPEPDVCDDYAEADLYDMGPGVYKKGYEPVNPHPNCLCYIIPVLQDQQEFVGDLERWLDDPSSVPYMEEWYENVYQEWPAV